MRKLFDDLWETKVDSPFPGLTTHAYFWTPHRVLFYSPASDAEFDDLENAGGVAHQYLSHRDEAGPILAAIKTRFGALLHAPAGDLAEITEHADVDVTVADRDTDQLGIETVPTPGHSPGAVCYLVPGAEGRYLFTGDTLFRGADGRWHAGYIDAFHQPADADAIADSLDVMAELNPDVVVSSAFSGDSAVHRIEHDRWRDHLTEAKQSLPTRSASSRGR
ncbi:MBL fold metallo-hydrolase [Mycobacterium sp. SMC-4]|uniref:MBL fold metallo-hydrolase n=1 Tax=Mycobacterium sp. SMC-4 TaxID=2857059 RepID=UPI0021B405F5|nr:MBL fold metallo-hydrolase [Mycobacterium sp. SMC-4]UXA17802.1 MBL fold metallo-hydrolase [Mycobacterium sp. SMC-4]